MRACGALLASIILSFTYCPGESCMVPPVDYRGIIGHDSKEAIVFFDKGIEDLTLRVDYKADGDTTPSRLAWIITVPSQPISYSVGNNGLFEDLYWWLKTEDPFAPPQKSSYDGVAGGFGGGPGLIVGKAVTVGPYQIQPVRALGMNALSALNKWLKDNGFPIENASHTAYFVEHGFTFLCVKVLPQEGQARLATSSGMPPIRLAFKTTRPYVPLRFSTHEGAFNVKVYLFTRAGLDYSASKSSLANINWTGTSVDRSPWPHEVQVNSLKDQVHFMDVLVGTKSPSGGFDIYDPNAGPSSLNNAYSTALFRDKVSLWRLNVIDGKQVNKDNSIRSWKEDTFLEPLKKSFSRRAVQDQVMNQAFAACQAQAARANKQATSAANRIAYVYREQDQMEDAQRVYRWIVSVDEKSKPDSYELGSALGDLAFVLGKRGKLAESIESYENAVAVFSKRPEYDASLSHTLQELAPAYMQAGKLAEAVGAYERAIAILQKKGYGHDIPEMRCQIALIWLKQGDLVRAETIMKKQLAESLEKQKPTTPPIPAQHMAFCNAMRARAILGIIYTHQHKYGKAEPLFKAAIPHLGKRYYRWHDAGSSGQQRFEPDIVRAAFDSYGNLLRATNRAKEADSLASKYGGDASKSNNGPPSRGVRL